jgi:hypothetical protein
MILLSIKDVKPGMKTAKSVTDGKGNLLVREGTELSEKWLERLKARGVRFIYVESEAEGAGLTPEQIEEKCRQVEAELERMFEGTLHSEVMQHLLRAAKAYARQRIERGGTGI